MKNLISRGAYNIKEGDTMNLQKLIAVCIAVSASVLIACKPTTENEVKKYSYNVESVTKQIALFPAFKPMLNKLLSDAKAKWDASNALSSSDEKAKAMKAANDLFIDNSISGGLNSYTGHVENVKKLQRELYSNKDRQYAYTISRAISDGDRALTEAGDLVTKAAPKDDTDAAEIIKKANGVLISKEGDLGRLKKSLEPKKDTSTSVKKK